MSTLKLDTIASRDGTESTDVTNVINGSAKAWVNFDGTGTVAIRDSFNVSSITDDATGRYTISFTNAMPDVNYAFSASVQDNSSGAEFVAGRYAGTYATTALQVQVWNYAGTEHDTPIVNVIIFR